jgi:hypothetical protein
MRSLGKGVISRGRDVMTVFVAGTLSLFACGPLHLSREAPTASLRTDSAEVGVHRNGFAYVANIGFTYVNTTDKPVSKAGCGFPPLPELEKRVDGKWVSAYSPGYLLCLSKPDFMLRSGEAYHGVIPFLAYEPGHNAAPRLDVASIDGIYRLRWDMVEGTDATDKDARIIRSTSNEFRMVLGPARSPTSNSH